MIEKGTWKARCCEAVLGFTSKGNDQIGLDFVLLEGPNQGSHITWYGYFTEDSFERTIESLRLCGWEGNDLSVFSDTQRGKGSGIDRSEIALVVDHEPDQHGEIRSRANWVNPLGGVAMKERMDDGASKSFAARMKGKITALQQGGGGARQSMSQRMTPAQERQQQGQASGQNPSDDIPF